MDELYQLIYGFIQSAIQLKRLPRQGWIRVGIPLSDVESIADHAYNVAMLSLLLSDLHNSLHPEEELNTEIVMRIAIIHDLPECKYQDFDRQLAILLGEDKYQEFKNQVLTTASTELLSLITNEDVKSRWKEMFDDLQDRESLESKFVSYVDKLEVLIQALSYESLGYHSVLFDDFWKTSKEFLDNCDFDVINELIPILEEERANLYN
ncbi:MAG: HD domain-containing protein [Candidatus Heimdallarchaeota archaeon]|nr:HD domain-containing protein [Candidatus Heimdallarchaeota archaeon]MCK4877207.1 HD domain-containing protein [Candidatus Heimdallarchaeota archaeon]